MGVRERDADSEIVAASQTAQVLGAVGGVGNYLARVIITASTGTITILDGAVIRIVIPIAALGVWEIGMISKVGPWTVTTAASTSCVCVGNFS